MFSVRFSHFTNFLFQHIFSNCCQVESFFRQIVMFSARFGHLTYFLIILGRSCHAANCTGNCGRAHSDPSTPVEFGKQNSPVTASSRNRNRKFRENPTSKSRAQKKPFRRGDCCQKIAQRKGQISLFGLFHKVFLIFDCFVRILKEESRPTSAIQIFLGCL